VTEHDDALLDFFSEKNRKRRIPIKFLPGERVQIPLPGMDTVPTKARVIPPPLERAKLLCAELSTQQLRELSLHIDTVLRVRGL
jgi:hypothetical protein